jgi:predicted  nucleic acid-binding Zn-ribbon protein
MKINAWRELVLGAHEALDVTGVPKGTLNTRIRALTQHSADLVRDLNTAREEATKLREEIVTLEAQIERQNNVAPPAPTYDEYNQAVVNQRRYGRTQP